jgi:phospholipid/cholesterol/gamma-HCH transport system substrate-binding protein
MGDQIKNMLVGLVMLSACAFTIALILFLSPSVGNGEKTYYARFSNINGIGDGTRVTFAGKPVGEVTEVTEIHDARDQPSDPFNRVYFYQLTLSVDSSVTIYNTDKIEIQTSGLLGERSIAVVPVTPAKNVIPKKVGKEPIYAQSSDPIETAFAELSQLADEMEGTFRYLNTWLNKNGDNLAGAVLAFKNALEEADKALATVNDTQLIHEAKRGITNFSNSMEQIDKSMKELEEGGFFTNANVIAKSVGEITTTIAAGEGTVGRLIQSDDMYLRATSLLGKADTMMNDINHYGVLFHLNKTWQRERVQKITLMNSLDSPSSFRTFFEDEVESINLVMSRLSMLMEKAERNPNKERIFRNKAFTKDFAEFLREIDGLAENVKLYNEQLVELQKAE